MKLFRKITAGLLAFGTALSLAACGEKTEDTNTMKIGLLESESLTAHKRNITAVYPEATESEQLYYNNLSSALMDLGNGAVNLLALEESTVDYIAARNENIVSSGPESSTIKTSFSMMTLDSAKETYDILNNALVEMKEDGTLDALIENELKAYTDSDPAAKELPKFDGAKTITIGITGDLPPMDFVTADGKAAGFNIALLTEIANRTQVNFELVQIETGARPIALSSGKVDAIFWTKSVTCRDCGKTWKEEIEGTLITESYFSDNAVFAMPKEDK